MLATEETKTVWKDVSGTQWDSKEAAEHQSVTLQLHSRNIIVNPSVLVKALLQKPEAKAWLLQQLGVEQQVVDMSIAFGNAARVALKADAVHALDKISEMAIKRVMRELQEQGYQLVKRQA